ncbi:MAG: LysM peptidoglycan-binding domain-containing protein [Candidatus Eremiobacterota bacterium]
MKKFFYFLILFMFSLKTAFADTFHEVKPSETLTSIAKQYGVSLKEILSANSIDEPDKIHTGQIIVIPSETSGTIETSGTDYEVKQGDTLCSISRKYGVSLQEILSANSLNKDDKIKTGDILKIPTGFTVEGPTHYVKEGETMSSIANSYGVSVISLCNANSISNPNRLRTGRLLVIPEKDNTTDGINKFGESAIIQETVATLKGKPSEDGETVTQTVMGDIVSIKEISGDWYFIRTPEGYFGWVTENSLSPVTDGNSKKIIISALMADIACMPEENSDYCGHAVMGSNLTFIKKEGQWVEVMLPSGHKGWIKEEQVLFKPKAPQNQEEIVKTAKMYLGVPYLWGGTTPLGVDCSGFIFTVYKMNGYIIPRDAESQFNYCEHIEDEKLLPGDLVFFTTYLPGPSHVGIYLGDGNFIHASSSKGVTVSSINGDYYKCRYLGGGRIKEIVSDRSVNNRQ